MSRQINSWKSEKEKYETVKILGISEVMDVSKQSVWAKIFSGLVMQALSAVCWHSFIQLQNSTCYLKTWNSLILYFTSQDATENSLRYHSEVLHFHLSYTYWGPSAIWSAARCHALGLTKTSKFTFDWKYRDVILPLIASALKFW